jgi:N-acyl homoserine lactone hydrolase
MRKSKDASKTDVQELHILDGGAIDLDQSSLTAGHGMGQTVRVPTPMVLIRTRQGNVLFDTGWSPEIVPVLAQLGYNPSVTEEHALPGRLAELGLKPDDIRYVVLSHLHVDHAGGVQFLPNAEFIVQRSEFRYAFHPHSFNALVYNRTDFDFPSFNWRIVDGDQVLMPGLSIVLANGHSAGLQALVVDLPETGVIVLGSDSCYTTKNIEEEIIPGFVWDPTLALHSITKLKTLASLLNGQIFPGHDIELWNTTLRKSPESYK